MVDRRPDRAVADERSTLLGLWQYQRESLVRKVEGIDDASARRQFVSSGTTLLWLIRHVARAERTWVVDRFAGQSAVSDDDTVSMGDTVAAAVEDYRATWVEVDRIIAGASFDDVCLRPGAAGDANLRWVVMHLLEETARHAGHADIIRELIDGATGR